MCVAGTEAQMRAALHAHILCWYRPRRSNAPVQPAVKRTAPGTEPKQRPRAQQVEPLADEDYREDNMYQNADVARVVTEMVRPYVRASADGIPWGGFGWPHLRVAGLNKKNKLSSTCTSALPSTACRTARHAGLRENSDT